MKTCTLVWEYHLAPSGGGESQASVWLFAGDGRQDLKRRAEGWLRIAGPTNIDLATQICASLKKFFVQNGVEVFEESAAD
jgi:hypothetical protein